MTNGLDAAVKSFAGIIVAELRVELLKIASELQKISRANRVRLSRAPKKRLVEMSSQRKSALKLQGKYMGHLRGLNAKDQARAKVVRASKGYKAAISLARKLSKRRS